jgi:hypothetical protein
MARTSYIRWDDDDVHLVQDQHAKLDLYTASSQKQQQHVDMTLHSDKLSWFQTN